LEAREKILEAADRLFGEVGFDAASTREIAELSGVNKALIHYHFRTKDALLLSVLDRYYDRLNRSLLASIGAGGPFRERIKRVASVYADFLAENLNFSRIVQRESSGGPHLDRIRDHLLPPFQVAVKLIENEFPASRKKELSAANLLVSLYGMIVTYFTYSAALGKIVADDPLSPKNLEARKQHLFTMIDAMVDKLEAEPKKEKGHGHATGKNKRGR
jgi:TetR/AcrR family transcriptional regulator